MKCIHCQHNTIYKVRKDNGGRCEQCKHVFAFDPKTPRTPITDGAFKRSIDLVSGNGKVAFTEKQLYYEFNRRRTRRPAIVGTIALVVVTAVVLTFCSVILRLPWQLILGLLIVSLALIVGSALYRLFVRGLLARVGVATVNVSISLADFQRDYLLRWTHIHGAIPKLIDASQAARPARLAKETDLTSYSFDRAVVVERADLAAMLVANNFHFENNCAILSLDGYPAGTAETVLRMVQRNPNVQVFAVHDASVAGLGLAALLRANGWFPETATIVDLGPRPSQAWLLQLPTLDLTAISVPDAIRERLSPREAAWLERGRVAEVEAIRPARLMRALYQGFARVRALNPNVPTVAPPSSRLPWSIGLTVGLLALMPWIPAHSYGSTPPRARRQDGGDGVDLPDFDFSDDSASDFAAADSFG